MTAKRDKVLRVLVFTSCGHCPLAVVKLQGKCEPMKVYCPLQREKETGVSKLVYETSYIGSLHPDCPLPAFSQLLGQFSGRSSKETKEFVEHCNRVRGTYRYGQGTNTKKDLNAAMPNRSRVK